ncbi:hypothetical protein ACM26V_16865 [Salipaludibacillus sp. HK11]|uniref:hypothetical protein n=1 Tax=Salipaludibacillus sp. HK11 TaxID=3394320 RepID=UPI0039FD1CFB
MEEKEELLGEVEKVEEEVVEGKSVPYERFKEVNDKYKLVKDELETVKADLEALKSNNLTNEPKVEPVVQKVEEVVEEVEEVLENPNPLEEKVTQYEEMFNQMLVTKLESVPEEYKDLVPEGDTTFKLKWIDSAIAKGLFSKKIQNFGNQGSNPLKVATDVTKEKFKKMNASERSKIYKENPELYKQLKSQM